MIKKVYYVYIMASKTGTLYIGFTNNLLRRIWEHKQGLFEGFSKKYKCNKLVYYEKHDNQKDAVNREKQLKRWRRDKKEKLIRKVNPSWKDLSLKLFKIHGVERDPSTLASLTCRCSG